MSYAEVGTFGWSFQKRVDDDVFELLMKYPASRDAYEKFAFEPFELDQAFDDKLSVFICRQIEENLEQPKRKRKKSWR